MGLFNAYPINETLAVILGIIILDFMRYLQHRLYHKIPLLWRLHRVHHTDWDFDISTSVRHHPLEAILGILFDWSMVIVFGLPPVTLILSAIAGPPIDIFNHSNIRLPKRADTVIRWIFVTPDMHRVHHSTYRPETDSNFSGFLSCWDRIFRTYCAQPQHGHQKMAIGLDTWQRQTDQSFFRLLANPFLDQRAVE